MVSKLLTELNYLLSYFHTPVIMVTVSVSVLPSPEKFFPSILGKKFGRISFLGNLLLFVKC
jgi:hypothetical protein